MTSNRRRGTGEAEVTDTVPAEGGNDVFQRIQPSHGRTCGPTRRSTKGQWTAEEDELLCRAVQRFKGRNWKKIAECFKDRTDVQCLHRWQKVLNPELVKGPWSKEEDDIIVEMVGRYGAKKWSTIAQALPGRIGKQCRERWHNHLNPAINKDAWTQEEELTLIRAHQLYGNKWAELTKFLPGRTDNSIKNHWNSSVKKKLDSYLASGLLAQFPALPNVVNANVCNSSSRLQQSSRDNSSLRDGTETEEVSECSQSSTAAGCSQSDFNRPNAVAYSGEELKRLEEGSQSDFNRPNVVAYSGEDLKRLEEGFHRKGQSSSSSSCSKQYYTSLDEVACVATEVPHGTTISSNFENELLYEAGSPKNDCSSLFDSFELPGSAQAFVNENSDLLGTHGHCELDVTENQESRSILLQNSRSFNESTTGGNTLMKPLNHELFPISEGDGCSVALSDVRTNECLSSGNMTRCSNFNNMNNGCMGSIIGQSESQSCQTAEILPSNSFYPRSSDVLGNSGCQALFTDPPFMPPNDDRLIFDGEYNELRDMCETHDSERIPNSCQDFTYHCNSTTPSDGNMVKLCLPVEPEQGNCSSNSNLAENFGSVSLNADANVCSFVETTPIKSEQQDPEALFYEPPRFPSLELPFFSCDLIPSGSDMQQAYSPLGIRQLMMTSMNCSTPFSLWDSPSRDDSPDLFLKSAAKSFIRTPSILKKRQRELLSPVQERKCDKKFEKDTSRGLHCTPMGSRTHFSSLDAIFDENGTCTASISSIEGALLSPTCQQKENSGVSVEDKENLVHGGPTSPDGKILENENDYVNSLDKAKQKSSDFDAMAKEQSYSGVLIEQDVNALRFFSPDRVGFYTNQSLSVGSRTPRNLYRGVALKGSAQTGCSDSSSWTVHISPTNDGRKHNVDSVPVSSVQCYTSTHAVQSAAENAGNNADIESFNLYSDTPLMKRSIESPSAWKYSDTPLMKRSIESPSAWKSPWFASSFLPGPRVDTDITIEDIGYLMSPGDGSYDALALMRQLGEQSASALAEAQEVLASKSSDLHSREQSSSQIKLGKENNLPACNDLDSDKTPPSDALNERRVLDFSECDTPVKGSESKNHPAIGSAVNFCSPSSYLMKGCR